MSLKFENSVKLVVNTKNTFLEVEEEVSQAEPAGPRSASCPPSCWRTAMEVEALESDDDMACFGSLLGESKAFIRNGSPTGFSTRTPSSTSSPLSSPRRGSLCAGDSAVESPPSSPKKPRRRGRGRRGGKVEFAATLDKREGGTHGIDIDWSNGTHLLIEKVNTPGLIAQWNEDHPEKQISAGHFIVEVNGIRGSATDLLEEMKKDDILQLKVQFKKAREPRADHSPSAAKLPSPSLTQRTPLRTVLTSQAPLFQPGSTPSSPVLSTGLATVAADSMWLAPQGMRAEFIEAVQELRKGLRASIPAQWSMDASDSTQVSFSAPTPARGGSAVVSSVQQAILGIVAKFPTVFLMGRSVNPFQALGQEGKLGFQVILCAVAKDKFPTTCWDTVSRGYCQHGCACTLEPPTDLLKVQIVLEPTEEVVCVPVAPLAGR